MSQARFYIEPIPGGLIWKMLQTTSPITVAFFDDWKYANWICSRLNTGNELSIAVENLVLDHIESLTKGDVATLIEEVQQALIKYKREP